jgi:hypothetical protein
MLEALHSASELAYRDTKYFGEHQELLNLRAEVAAQSESTPIKKRFYDLYDLALMELEQGNPPQAIEYAQQATKVFRQPQVRADMLDAAKLLIAQAYLRIAEDQNCCANPGAETCVFPIAESGQHRQEEGSRKALPFLLEVAGSSTVSIEDRFDARWLIPIASMTLGEYPAGIPELYQLHALPADDPASSFPVFKNVGPEIGIDRFSMSGAMIVDDFRGRGDMQVINSTWDPASGVQLHQWDDDEKKFKDRTASANLEGISGGLNMRHADFDNDGDLDVLVLRGAWLNKSGRHPNSLLRNDGVGKDGNVRFTDVTFACGLAELSYPTGTAEWADFDLDGDLDLFIGNETEPGGVRYPCQLFRNDGPSDNGMVRFVDIAAAAGVEVFSFAKGVSWGDFNGDRFPDLYVSCFGDDNRLFQNRGDGTFTDVAEILGVTKPKACFPTWFWDYNNDGHLDLFVSSFVWHSGSFLLYYQGEPLDPRWVAKLYKNNGEGRFVDATEEAGLKVPMMPMGSNFADLDNDGFPDVYLGTGSPNFGGIVPNLLLMNQGGKTFVDRTTVSGLGHLQKGHGVSFADFDRDGDLDIFEQLGGPYPSDRFFDAVFENPGFGNHWLEVRLKGVTSNSYGIGCRLRAVIDQSDGERSVYTWMNSGGSFGSNPLIAHLGLAKAKIVKRLEIFWPKTGVTQSFTDLAVDQRIVITEGEKRWRKY